MSIKKSESKLDKLRKEREKFNEALKLLLEKIEGNDSLTEETENTLIIELVRDMKISPETLKEILRAQKGGDFLSTQDIPEVVPDEKTDDTPDLNSVSTASFYERNHENEDE